MSLRFSLEDAKRFGVSDKVISEVLREAKASSRGAAPSLKTASKTPARHKGEDPPQAKLFRYLTLHPESKHLPWVWEVKHVVPGRKYTVDIGCSISPRHRLAIEVDGFSIHGLNLENYYRDREKDWLLELHDWSCLRIPAGLINTDIDTVQSRILTSMARLKTKHLKETLLLHGLYWHRSWLLMRTRFNYAIKLSHFHFSLAAPCGAWFARAAKQSKSER